MNKSQVKPYINSSRGFTLMEVLISLAITSFIVTALYATFFLSQKAIASIDDSLIRLQEARSAMDILKREIESAYFNKESEYQAFKLEDRDYYGRSVSRITFTSFSPLFAGVVKISYHVEETDSSLILVKTLSSPFQSKAKAKNIELIDDIYSFSVEVKYRGKWVKTWDSKTAAEMPEEVKITISLSKKDSDTKNQESQTLSIFDIAKPMIGKSEVL